MCLIAWNWQPHSRMPLVLVANRDEFYARPALAMHWWPGEQVLAGKDLQAGGTWLGLSRNGRLAALTNYRSRNGLRACAPSRGTLVAAFLNRADSAMAFIQDLQLSGVYYNPFNLLLFDGATLMGFESSSATTVRFQAGPGAVSNARFGTPWPKLLRLQEGLTSAIDTGNANDAALWSLLQDCTPAPDHLLPSTGISLEQERTLSAPFTASDGYGTRASSIVRISANGASALETSYSPTGSVGQVAYAFAF